MKIINNSASLDLYDLINTHDDLYFRDLDITTHSYQNSLVIIDLANAMKNGKRCPRWLLRCTPWHMDNTRLCLSEYIDLAFPDCDTLADLISALRSGSPKIDKRHKALVDFYLLPLHSSLSLQNRFLERKK